MTKIYECDGCKGLIKIKHKITIHNYFWIHDKNIDLCEDCLNKVYKILNIRF